MLGWLKSLVSKENNLNRNNEQKREGIESITKCPAITVYASMGQIEAVRIAIKNGDDVDARNESNSTALIIAASRNDFAMVKVLIEEGNADPCVHNYFDKTPFYWSNYHNNQEMTDYLKEAQPLSNPRPFC